METTLTIILTGIVLTLFLFIWKSRRKKPGTLQTIPPHFLEILNTRIPFYIKLNKEKKKEFEERMMHFLSATRITGVNTEPDDEDKVFIAASAIIPIFGFPSWEYNNLNEILLYPDSFDHDFAQTGENRNILGIVGEGAYNKIMILSRQQLKRAFANPTDRQNTAIHEFVHLIDKSDGSIDGVPSLFVDRQYALPWLKLIQKEIREIMADRSDIDPYGATNEAEFFAVVSEYFFEHPELLKSKHPELYELLTQVFKQKPAD